MRIVLHPHRNPLWPFGAQGAGNVGPERGVSALMFRHQMLIHPDRAGIVHGAEVQEQPALARRRFELALIPAYRMKAGITDATARTFRCEGHLDAQGPDLDITGQFTTTRVIEGEFPLSIQAVPFGALQLRAGMQRLIHAILCEKSKTGSQGLALAGIWHCKPILAAVEWPKVRCPGRC